MSKYFTASGFEAMMVANGQNEKPRYGLYVLIAAAWTKFGEDEEYVDAKRALDYEQCKGNCAILYDYDLKCYIA